MYNSGVVLEKVCEYLYYNQKHAESKDVSDMDIPPELCLELLIAADYLDGMVIVYTNCVHANGGSVSFSRKSTSTSSKFPFLLLRQISGVPIRTIEPLHLQMLYTRRQICGKIGPYRRDRGRRTY